MGQIQPAGRLFISASWVLPISDRPLAGGVVALEGGRIAAVLPRSEFESKYAGSPLKDYGQAVIMPGLINLHSHLDYTTLRFFDTDSTLFDWIRGLTGQTRTWEQERFRNSALEGAAEAALSGTSCLADSSYSGAAAWAAASVGLRAVVGLELFGLSESECRQRWDSWLARLQATGAEPPVDCAISEQRIKLTVSPHAPYTVCPSLWAKAADWARSNCLPVLTHLCETEQEMRWLAAGDQQIDQFLEAMLPACPDLASLSWKGQGLSPVAHLERHNLLVAPIVAAHLVHASKSDFAILSRAGASAAHCSRSNARLRSGVAPLAGMKAAGLKVGFGTDSAASCDDLDLLKEARFAINLQRAANPAACLSSDEALAMLTIVAARALGIDDQVGSLEAGKKADIAIFALSKRSSFAHNRPHDLLILGEGRLVDLFVDGKQIVSAGRLNFAASAPSLCLPGT
jgi:5-methylthioadenosine/S-adenosylhomocysteine deaminase